MAMQGVEPWTFALLARRSNQLSYTAWLREFEYTGSVSENFTGSKLSTLVCLVYVRTHSALLTRLDTHITHTH